MSPTSCRCSTPRRPAGLVWVRSGRGLAWVGWPGIGRGSSGGAGSLWSDGRRGRGVPAAASPPTGSPLQYSPALRRVTTGFGMGPGGATALSATGTPRPPRPTAADAAAIRTGPRLTRNGSGDLVLVVWCWLSGVGCLVTNASGTDRALPADATASSVVPAVSRLGNGAQTPLCACHAPAEAEGEAEVPSLIRTGRLRSLARRPPPAYQPGGLPGSLPRLRVGHVVLGRDSRLDAFSGSLCRT